MKNQNKSSSIQPKQNMERIMVDQPSNLHILI